MIPIDVDVAFLNAELDKDDEVYVGLPAQWAKANEPTAKRLLKALYGLRQSPRARYKKHGVSLRSLGWEPCANEPGLWRRLSAVVPGRIVKMGVYVDERLATGPCGRELDAGVAREVARAVLPVATYSSMYVSMNARALMNFLSLRTAREGSHFPSYPQREIEMVAEKMEAEFATLMPLTYGAFEKSGRIAP